MQYFSCHHYTPFAVFIEEKFQNRARCPQSWLSVLETSYIIYLLKPYYKNFGKRIIKNPKLYFYDTGLVTSLLNITSPSQIESFYMRKAEALFENFIVCELLKRQLFAGKTAELYFWRDSNDVEIDVLEEHRKQQSCRADRSPPRHW